MAHAQPPVPPGQRSPIARGRSKVPDDKRVSKHDAAHDLSDNNLRERGDSGNRAQNLTAVHKQENRRS
jgi:hypothetical protein